MTTYPWPAVLPAARVAFNPRGMTVAGPATLTGQSQVLSTDAGYWVATLELATLTKGAPVNAFRALRAKLEGGAHQVLVPVFDTGDDDNGQVPWPSAGGRAANANAELPWSGGGSFFWDDGHGWFNPKIVVAAAAAAAAGATVVDVAVTTAGTISEGMKFGIGDRLYVLREMLSPTRWAIWPKLREAVALGAEIRFENPVCKMRLMREDDMDLALGRRWVANPSIGLIESF